MSVDVDVEFVKECIRNSIVSFQRGALTYADLIIRIAKSPLPREWKNALVQSPTLATLLRLEGQEAGVTIDVLGVKITVTPPAIVATRTKRMAAAVLHANPIASPWREQLGDVVVASVAKVLSSLVTMKIQRLEQRPTIVLTSDGTLERTAYAIANADGVSVLTNGFAYVPKNDEFTELSLTEAQFDLDVAVTVIPLSIGEWERVDRAVLKWKENGGNFGKFSVLTGRTEDDLPYTTHKWYIYSTDRDVEDVNREEVQEIMVKLIAAGLDPEPAKEIARILAGGVKESDYIVIANTLAYYYPLDTALRLAKVISEEFSLNQTALEVLVSSVGR